MSFSSYTTPADKQRFVNWVLKNYTEDVALAKWLGDQMFGKARERVEVSGEMTINHLARLQAIQKKLEGHEE